MDAPALLSRLLAPLLAVAALAACGPIYDTQYHFTPPSDSSGRQLVGQCRMTQQMCKQNCQMQENLCRSEARSRGMMEYQRYVEERRRQNAPLKRSPDSFISTSSCDSDRCDDNCDRHYRNCYVESGGRISSKEVCVAFCDQGKKN